MTIDLVAARQAFRDRIQRNQTHDGSTLGWHFLRFPNIDPSGWILGYGPYHISYTGIDKYRYDGHPFRIQWRGGFVSFGKWSRWGS